MGIIRDDEKIDNLSLTIEVKPFDGITVARLVGMIEDAGIPIKSSEKIALTTIYNNCDGSTLQTTLAKFAAMNRQPIDRHRHTLWLLRRLAAILVKVSYKQKSGVLITYSGSLVNLTEKTPWDGGSCSSNILLKKC